MTVTVGEAVWKEFTAALEEAAALGEQISRWQEAIEEEEAAALAAMLEITKPVLPHIAEKVMVSYYHPGGRLATAEKDFIEGVILVDEWRKAYNGPDDTRGTYVGERLVLTGEGVLLVLTRKGHWSNWEREPKAALWKAFSAVLAHKGQHWSNWQREPTSWEAESEEVSPREAVQRFDFADIVQGLMDSLREAVKRTEEQKKKLEERAARLAQFKKLLED